MVNFYTLIKTSMYSKLRLSAHIYKKAKSVTAAEAIKWINPNVNVTAHTLHMGPESEGFTV